MNQKTYEIMSGKYNSLYGYGATAKFSKDEAKNRAINETRYQNLKVFLDENPTLVKPKMGVHCQRHLLIGGQWSCYIRGKTANDGCVHMYPRAELFDHRHSLRFKGIRKSHILITHPYCDEVNYPVQEVSKELLKGLTVIISPPEKSWYYPDSTCLIFIARPELLDMLSLDFLGNPITTFEGELEG